MVLSGSIFTSVPLPNPRPNLSLEPVLSLAPNLRSLSLVADDPLAVSPLTSVSLEPEACLPLPNWRSLSFDAEVPRILEVLAPLSGSSFFSPGLIEFLPDVSLETA